MRPPYLLDRRDSHDRGGVTVVADIDTAIVVMAVHGPWTRHLTRDAFAGFKKCLSEHPAALVLDLRTLSDPRAASVATWITAHQVAAAMDPPVQVTVCLPADTALAGRLHRLRPSGVLSMYANVAQACTAAISLAPRSERLRLHLAPDPDAPALARDLVTDACAVWRLPALLHPGRLVVSELTANAAQHARTPIIVRLSPRAGGLHLAVGDGDPRLPRLRQPRPESSTPARSLYEEPGQGLRLVDAAATRWGALPTRDGKIVWATLYPRGGRV